MNATMIMRKAPINTPSTIPTTAPVDSSSSVFLPPIVVFTDGVTDKEVVDTTAKDGVMIILDITMVSTIE